MKAASRFLSAASAVALSAGLVTSATVGTYFASVVAASAAVVSRIDVRGNQRVDAETIRYLNRLSDAFFVWSRWVIAAVGGEESLWRPNAATGE